MACLMHEMSTLQHVESHISIQKYPQGNVVYLYFTTDVFRTLLCIHACNVRTYSCTCPNAFIQPYMTYVCMPSCRYTCGVCAWVCGMIEDYLALYLSCTTG